MEYPVNLRFFPTAFFNIIRGINKGFAHIMANKASVKAVSISGQTGRPLPFPISVLTVFQAIDLVILYRLKNIGYNLPMIQIFGTQNGRSRHVEHRGGYHIINIPNPKQIRIRHVRSNYRILYLHLPLTFRFFF